MATEASYQAVGGSDRFCLLHLPQGKPRGGIVYLHPFAEEMNRSRQIAARQARAFAAAGYAVLQMDLHGCGDSAGNFGDASWTQWRLDAHAAVRLLQQRCEGPLCLWGLRSGALLASEVARELDDAVSLLFWQPVLSGKQHLQQFLRLSLAADMLEGRSQANTQSLQAQLEAGRPVEIAGYSLSPALAEGLAYSELGQPLSRQRMHCIEITPSGDDMSPALRRFIDGGTAAGSVCSGPQCWLTPGISSAPALEAASLAAIGALLS